MAKLFFLLSQLMVPITILSHLHADCFGVKIFEITPENPQDAFKLLYKQSLQLLPGIWRREDGNANRNEARSLNAFFHWECYPLFLTLLSNSPFLSRKKNNNNNPALWSVMNSFQTAKCLESLVVFHGNLTKWVCSWHVCFLRQDDRKLEKK